MKAGRALDRVIAKKVLGMHRHPHCDEQDCFGANAEEGYGSLLEYSTDIVAAWPLLERVPGGFCVIYNPQRKRYYCSLWKRNVSALADTAPLAICLAVLKAVKT